MANSYNELFGLGSHSADADLTGWWKLQDDAASTTVVDATGVDDGFLRGGNNTADVTTTGPGGPFTKALAMDGSADYIDGLGIETEIGTPPFTIGFRANFSDITTQQRIASGRPVNFSGAHFWIQSSEIGFSHYDGSFYGKSRSTTGLSTGTWYDFIAAVTATPAVTARFNNADITGTTTRGANIGADFNIGCAADETQFSPTTFADFVVFNRALSSAEMQQWENGPEPTYTSGISFSADGTYSVGTWDSQSNGTATYEVIAANAAGSVIDSASTSSGDLVLSAENGNTVYLLVRASNTGGYDIGDKATRTSAYGSSNDGYYELASVTASDGAGGGPSHASTMLLAGVGI